MNLPPRKRSGELAERVAGTMAIGSGVSEAFLTSWLVAGYAAARIFVEFYRVPDEHLGYLAWGWLTQGQVLSFVMFLIGVGIIGYDAVRRKRFFSTD
ncbi:MAG: prolipoprotein diacylglyceryl transferase [FCB group bacterium]|nr:prolipoprotein diacylglyceryl transferase [FCB group bacterium]